MNEELEIGRWGEEWQRFMRENFPTETAELEGKARFDELAVEVDNEAWELRQLLRSQYAKENPRPTTFEQIAEWENTLGFIVDREILEQVVQHYRE